MSESQHGANAGTPNRYRLPLNISLPYIYNWNSYDGLPVSTTDRLTWNSFPAGEPTAFLISAASQSEINQPRPINGQPVPRPADIEGNPVDMDVYSSKESRLPFDVAVSLVPQNTGPTPHVHWSDNEWFYVLSGSITLYASHKPVSNYAIPGVDGAPLADELYEIKLDAGQLIYGPSNMIHSFTNYSNEPATWLTIWQREQNELEGGITQFFSRGDIAPLVLNYDASVDYYQNADFLSRVSHWAKVFPAYNVTISDNFGSYISSGVYDPAHPNQPGENNPNVIKGAPQEVLNADNALTLSSLFQSFQDLQTSISSNRKTVLVQSVGGKNGLAMNLEVGISHESKGDSTYGYFQVDNQRGDIDGVKPGSPGYLEKAKSRFKHLYSQLSNVNDSTGEGNKTIAVETGDVLGFFERERTGSINLSTTQPHSFNLVNRSGSYQATEKVIVNTRLKGSIADVNTIISGHNDEYQHPLLDTSPLGKRESPVHAKFKVVSPESSPYKAGYYRVINAAGDVIAADGRIVSPGQADYESIALSEENLADELNSILKTAAENDGSAAGTFKAGDLYAPFVTVSRKSGGEKNFFTYKKANTSNSGHILSTGSNTFVFRTSESSKQLDELRIAASFSLEEEEGFHGCSDHHDQTIEIQNHGLSAGSLVFYQVDPLTGGVDGLIPGDKGYRQAAYAWGKKKDTIMKTDELPDLYSSISYTDLGLNPEHTYGMLYVSPKGRLSSSYSQANEKGRQAFTAYGTENCLHTYGLESSGSNASKTEAGFNDLIISSTTDNITVWA